MLAAVDIVPLAGADPNLRMVAMADTDPEVGNAVAGVDNLLVLAV